jgi:hypothetical protein
LKVILGSGMSAKQVYIFGGFERIKFIYREDEKEDVSSYRMTLRK